MSDTSIVWLHTACAGPAVIFDASECRPRCVYARAAVLEALTRRAPMQQCRTNLTSKRAPAELPGAALLVQTRAVD
jgi:hypothetical protein